MYMAVDIGNCKSDLQLKKLNLTTHCQAEFFAYWMVKNMKFVVVCELPLLIYG
jgi:hypothetical protein